MNKELLKYISGGSIVKRYSEFTGVHTNFGLEKSSILSTFLCKCFMDDFNQQLIVYNDIAQKLCFTLTKPGFFVNNTVYFMKAPTEALPYLLAFLNSKLIDWYYRTLSVQLGTQAVRLFSIYVEKLPIPKNTNDFRVPKNDIDIYEAYQLTSEEIKYLSEINV